ncbi:M23 family metallopeptidase [Candidatus Dojkabacteria bacterium]|nr:M23 family metallopeptidase [Candidatus Dojkabacteria bacterium]
MKTKGNEAEIDSKPPLVPTFTEFLNLIGTVVADIFLYFLLKIKEFFMLWDKFLKWITKIFLVLKRWLMKHMFWGRGEVYRYFTQAATIGVFLLVIIVGTVNKPITESILLDQAYTYYAGVAQRDLLVESGSVETLIPQERTSIEMMEYVVKKDDSLSSIANAYGVSVDTIKWANNLTNVHVVRQGTVLKIPPGDGIMYTVKKNDTIDTIATEYEVSSQAIVDMNWLDPPFTLKVGDTLFIPNATMPIVDDYRPDSDDKIIITLNPVDPNVGRFLDWPAPGAKVTQCASWYHVAIDMSNSAAPDILAAAEGTVIFSGRANNGFGWHVQIAHPNGYTTVYAHMQALYVVSGQYVYAGTPIGKMGATGYSTGVHLHFELRKGSDWANRVNPAPYMKVNVCGY